MWNINKIQGQKLIQNVKLLTRRLAECFFNATKTNDLGHWHYLNLKQFVHSLNLI